MKKTEEYYWQLLEWLKKEHPHQYNKYSNNIDFNPKIGEIEVNYKNDISDTKREILIRILEQHPPF